MPKYKTDRKAYLGGAVRQDGEEFYLEKPVPTRKGGKLPEWLHPVDQSAKEAAKDKAAANKRKTAKQKEAEAEELELKTAGVGNKKADFMDGEVEQV